MRTATPGMRWAAALMACVVLTGAVEAQEIRGFYVGVGAGIFNYEESEDIGPRISDGAGIYRIVGGYQLNSNYAIEAGVVRSNDIKEQFFASNPTTGSLITLNLAVESEIKTLRVLAFAPFSGLGMFGSVGYYEADFTTTFSITDPLNPQRGAIERSDSGATVAGGIQYEWSRVALRGEYEWFDTDDIDTTAINLIAVFRF